MNKAFGTVRVGTLLSLCMLAACGDDGGGTVLDDANVDTGEVGGDVEDTGETDAGDDTDAAETTDAAGELAPDAVVDEPEPEICPESILCIDERTGNPSAGVCLAGGFPVGSICERQSADVACCVAPFACATDADCEAAREDEGFCGDERFPCVCLDDGNCAPYVCSAASECDAGEECIGGLCAVPPDSADYVALILTPDSYAAADSSVQVDAVAVLDSDASIVNPGATIEWEVTAGTATIDDNGLLAIAGTGTVTVRATVAENDEDPGDTVSFVVTEAPAADTRRIVVLDEASRVPIEGAAVAYRSASLLVSAISDADGIVDIPSAEADEFHIFADSYSYVSVFDAEGDLLVISLPPTQRAQIDEVRDGFVCETEREGVILDDDACGELGEPVCLCYELQGIDVVKGVPDFTSVVGDGEVDVSISGFSIGNALLDLNFDLIVGPQIERIIPDNPVIPLEDPVDIPSGITLYFNNSPFVDSFIATAPAGTRSVWSVGGRIPLGDTLLALLPSLSGDLDFGSIVAAILPLFNDFYSGVTAPIDLQGGGTFPVREPGLRLEVPTQRRVVINPPTLPRVGAGWAETAIVLGGALVPGQGFVPLGISGGTDTIGRGEADGVIDGDHDTDGVQPLLMSMAPIHGAIAGEGTQYMILSIAIQIESSAPDAPREASSGIVTLLERGASLPGVINFEQSAFPALAEGTTWDAETRTVELPAGGDADLYRLVFRGEDNRLWVVYGAPDRTTFTLPANDEGLAFEDRTAQNRLNVVGVTLRESSGVDYNALLRADGGSLMDLFSFIESFSIIGL